MRKEIGHNSSLGWTEFVQEGGEKEVEVNIPILEREYMQGVLISDLLLNIVIVLHHHQDVVPCFCFSKFSPNHGSQITNKSQWSSVLFLQDEFESLSVIEFSIVNEHCMYSNRI